MVTPAEVDMPASTLELCRSGVHCASADSEDAGLALDDAVIIDTPGNYLICIVGLDVSYSYTMEVNVAEETLELGYSILMVQIIPGHTSVMNGILRD